MTDASSTIIPRHSVAPTTHTEQITEPAALLADTAELRDETTETSSEAMQLHRNVERLHLGQMTRELEAVPPTALLDALADEFLFPWSLLARIVDVSPTAVRKWRRGETVTPTFHHRLAEFLGFCRTLQQRDPRITNLPHWLEMPLDARVDITRVDLFLQGVRTELLDMAAGRRTGENLLDETVSGWRKRADRSEQFQVLMDDDGMPSIVPRSQAAPREG